jgi:Rieske 2Fe-2S family protein
VDKLPGVTDEKDRRYYAVTIRPNVFVNLVPDHVIFHRMFPLAPDRTIIECDWLYLPEVIASDVDLSKSIELFDRVKPAGLRGLRVVPGGDRLEGLCRSGVLVPSEHHIADFQNWATGAIAG